MHKQPNDPAATAAALKFFAWAFVKGGKMAEELDYVPMPGNVVGAVQSLWASQINDPAGNRSTPSRGEHSTRDVRLPCVVVSRSFRSTLLLENGHLRRGRILRYPDRRSEE